MSFNDQKGGAFVTRRTLDGVNAQDRITGNIKFVVTATQELTLDGDGKSIDKIRKIALGMVQNFDFHLKALEVTLPTANQSASMTMMGKALGAYGRIS